MSRVQLIYGLKDLTCWTMIVIKNARTATMQTRTIIARHVTGNVVHVLTTTLVLLVLKQVTTSTSTKTNVMRIALRAHIKTETIIVQLVTRHVVSALARKMVNALLVFKYLATTLSFWMVPLA